MRRRDFRLPAGQVAAKHHAAKFHSANAALKVKRIDEPDAGIIAWTSDAGRTPPHR